MGPQDRAAHGGTPRGMVDFARVGVTVDSVAPGGEVRQRLLTLAEPVAQEQLSAAAARLTNLLLEKNAGAGVFHGLTGLRID